jgi:hypothetical protein
MVSTRWISLVAALLLIGASNAFVTPCFGPRKAVSPLFAASMGTSEAKVATHYPRVDQDDLWLQQLETPQIQQVRSEMLAKYISLGKSSEQAEKEVDEFLHDRERAQPFVEMRQYAKRKFDDMGLEIVFQTSFIFLFCLFATLGLQYYSAYMVSENVWGDECVTRKIPFSHVVDLFLFPRRHTPMEAVPFHSGNG